MKRKKDNESKNLSRREFLTNAGIIVGGVALTSLAGSAGCVKTKTSNSTSTTPSSISTAPIVSTTGPVTITQVAGPELVINNNMLQVPGCGSFVAMDRLYSADHVWVKNLGDNTVQIGMTDPFQILSDIVWIFSLDPPGTDLVAEGTFGYMEAEKLSLDLITPVSGKILDTNTALMSIPAPINADPYGTGWMLRIKLSKPEEMDNLISPVYYAFLQSPNWPGPAPAKR
jgi:glycine cleavage system H protein